MSDCICHFERSEKSWSVVKISRFARNDNAALKISRIFIVNGRGEALCLTAFVISREHSDREILACGEDFSLRSK